MMLIPSVVFLIYSQARRENKIEKIGKIKKVLKIRKSGNDVELLL